MITSTDPRAAATRLAQHGGRPLVRMTGITKSFPGVRALDAVDLTVRAGTVMGLAGENGSGKSSLMKILAGWYQPDAGVVELDGESVRFAHADGASASGVSLVAQEIAVHPHLTVAENLAVGRYPARRFGLVDRRKLRTRASALLERYELDIDPSARLGDFPLRVQQFVSILKMASRSPRVLILDEPTSSLGEEEVRCLYRLVRELRDAGTAVVYVTHRLREYFDLCDQVTVLRDGVVTAACGIDELDEDALVRTMVGRSVDVSARTAPRPALADRPRLTVRGLSTKDKLVDIDLDVRPGEIVGVAGQAGAGRSTLAQTLFGLRACTGSVTVDGVPVDLRGPARVMEHGIAYIPEDRKRSGAVLTMSIADNLTMTRWSELSRGGVLTAATRRREAAGAISAMTIKAPNDQVLVRTLSGGNQQKVVIGKWLARAPKVLILDEPTRGIDVGAKREVYELVERFRSEGLAVLMFSSELTELLHMCDRILVLHRGRIVGELPAGIATEESITQMAFGHVRGGADEKEQGT